MLRKVARKASVPKAPKSTMTSHGTKPMKSPSAKPAPKPHSGSAKKYIGSKQESLAVHHPHLHDAQQELKQLQPWTPSMAPKLPKRKPKPMGKVARKARTR